MHRISSSFYWVSARRAAGALAAALTSLALASPPGVGAADLDWGRCPDRDVDPRQECALLEVPRDYAEPDGQTIEIAVSRIPAESPENRRGVILHNPGGPGDSGINRWSALGPRLPQNVRDQYDLIGFDPRGINLSAPVTCNLALEDRDVVRLIPYPAFDGDISENVAYSQRAAEGCAEAPTAGLLPHITTANTARDMDEIRRALGEPKISYLGYSYGTYLGSVYAELFPERVDRFVLDSNVHPRRIWRSTFHAWGPAAEVAFPGFARYAADRNETFGLGATPAAVREKFFELLGEVAREPFPLSPDFAVDHKWFRELLRQGLRHEASFLELATIWQLIDQREPPSSAREQRAVVAMERLRARATPDTPSAPQAARAGFPSPPEDNGWVGLWAVACGDADWPEAVDKYERDVDVALDAFPLVGPAAANIWPCAFWPFDPRDEPVDIGSLEGGHALLVQSLRDPATPYDGGVALRHTLGSRSRLVTVPNGGHSLAFRGTAPLPCPNKAAGSFLATGELPRRDIVCPREPIPEPGG